MISQVAGRAAVTVTSAAAVPMLSTATEGVSIPNAFAWTLIVSTTQDVSVKVYVSAGINCGLQLVSTWTTTATSAVPFVLNPYAFPCQRIYVTAQATGADATVNCDLIVQSSAVN